MLVIRIDVITWCASQKRVVILILFPSGTSIAGEFENLSVDEFERMLRINVLGSVYPTRALIESIKKKKADCPESAVGRVIFVSSQVAYVAIHGYTAYAASKVSR